MPSRTTALLLTIALAEPAAGIELEPLFETKGFREPESVLHDPACGCLYVSNVNGDATAVDGNGYVSRVRMDGTIEVEQAFTGLNAPKGLALVGRNLYVADIDYVTEYRLGTEYVTRYWVADARFLNDVTADRDGRVFVSDMLTNRIHLVADGDTKVWVEGEALENPNGLAVDGERLIVASWGPMTGEGFATSGPGHLLAVPLTNGDRSVTSLPGNPVVGHGDGLESDGNGGWFVTDWMAGSLLHVAPDGSTTELLDLPQGSADLEYVPAERLLLIPMMLDGTLRGFRVKGLPQG